MSDRLYPLEITHILNWMLSDLERGKILGISRDMVFTPRADDPFRMERYGQMLETPVGVAAGPHSQMAQNIVLSWLTGARYQELKTIQTLDDLEVSKPCIDMEDEGYNCEWSQELRLEQSFHEYMKAWILIHVLRDHFGWNSDAGVGCIFNMSVGYDLAGILQPNVQQFLDKMENCEEELDRMKQALVPLYPRIQELDIPARLSDNVTLSTMHGCPPEEVERIGRYLIEERHYHTTIKLNPTLLGPQQLREILHERLGYNDIIIPDEAFEHDLKYDQALGLIRRLQAVAAEQGVQFGLKLTNTLEVNNHKSVFPPREERMYLSGRALHPISINLAARLQEAFKGALDLSFCAGVDAFNVTEVVAANLAPVTVCTDLLKPGGYTRLLQYLDRLRQDIDDSEGGGSLNTFIQSRAGVGGSVAKAGLHNLKTYAQKVSDLPAYQKGHKIFKSIKTSRSLTPFDCVSAPCIDSCATEQDIPEYLHQVAVGNPQKALEVILKTNPLPGITGYVCDHLCQLKCTRNNLDEPLLIREIKRFVVEQDVEIDLKPGPANGIRVAIIGGGPSGLSCAALLALAGFEVNLYEKSADLGGMVSLALPQFRLPQRQIEADIKRIQRLGVNFHFDEKVNKDRFKSIQQNHDYIYLAIGAQKNKRLGIEGESLPQVREPLEFLSRLRRGQTVDIGSRVAVIGGGNTALDVARSARRLGSEVTILYRRTRREMPADWEEIEAAQEEGITIRELIAPLAFKPGKGKAINITTIAMKLGAADASGRARPLPVKGTETELAFDTVVPAIGQDVILDFIEEDLQVEPATGATNLAGVFTGGDAMRGASSVINAVGDGRRVARKICEQAGVPMTEDREHSFRLARETYQHKLARRDFPEVAIHLEPQERLKGKLVSRTLTLSEAKKEAERCLLCDDVCDICVSVCPNLANLSFFTTPKDYPVYLISKNKDGFTYEKTGVLSLKQKTQILNLGDFCNECGNCTTFCPTAGDPYRDKPRFFLSEETFRREESGYWLSGSTLWFKEEDQVHRVTVNRHSIEYEDKDIHVSADQTTYIPQQVQFKNGKTEILLERMSEMILLYDQVCDQSVLQQPGN